MSHVATHWLATVAPAAMTHAEFRVLFHLCDCHNASAGCFPKQAYLRDHTGLSNGGLNKALNELERKGLLRRERARDERTNRQKPTRYILGFELSETQEPSPLSGDGAVSTFGAVPSPLSEGSVSTGVESYTKEEPVKEPVREPCVSPGDPHTEFLDKIWDRFSAVFPRMGNVEVTEDRLRSAIEAGADPDHIIEAARAYADEQRGNKSQYIAFSENWLDQKRWERFPKPGRPAADFTAIAAQRARAIRAGQSWVARHLSPAAARDLVARGLVTAEECKAAGVTL